METAYSMFAKNSNKIYNLMVFFEQLVKQELLTLPERLSSLNVSDGFVDAAQSLVLCIVSCQSYLDLHFTITPLIDSNISRQILGAVIVL